MVAKLKNTYFGCIEMHLSEFKDSIIFTPHTCKSFTANPAIILFLFYMKTLSFLISWLVRIFVRTGNRKKITEFKGRRYNDHTVFCWCRLDTYWKMTDKNYAQSIDLPTEKIFRNLRHAKRFAVDIGKF